MEATFTHPELLKKKSYLPKNLSYPPVYHLKNAKKQTFSLKNTCNFLLSIHNQSINKSQYFIYSFFIAIALNNSPRSHLNRPTSEISNPPFEISPQNPPHSPPLFPPHTPSPHTVYLVYRYLPVMVLHRLIL